MYVGPSNPRWGQGRYGSWSLLGGEDRVATEGTRDEQLPVLQGQVPLHEHMQGDSVSDQALPAAEDRK